MPLVLDLLLLDEDSRLAVSDGGYHVAEARGLFAELQRQLQDPSSHLRRKSAFGALIGRGASVRFVCHEQHEAPKVCGVVAPPEQPALPGEAVSSSALPEGAGQPAYASEQRQHAEPVVLMPEGYNMGGKTAAAPPTGIATVPKILDFPKPAARPLHVPAAGMGMLKSLFGWMPTCAPTSCKAMPSQALDSCTIVVAAPEESAPCVPVPGGILSEDATAGHEAGLGGWPLCTPHAYAAFPAMGQCVDVSNIPKTRFRNAAVEIDDNELAVIFVPQRKDVSLAPTPSTASTADHSGTSSAHLPHWVSFNRMVLSREWICNAKTMPKLDATLCTPQGVQGAVETRHELGTPWPYLVELCGTPRGAPEPVTVLLALPSSSMAARVCDALNKPRRRVARPPAAAPAETRGAVRCELHIAARLNLDVGVNSINCAAVVRRGISEACHVGADRIRVCSIWEGDAGTHRSPSTWSNRGFTSEADSAAAGGLTSGGKLAEPERASPDGARVASSAGSPVAASVGSPMGAHKTPTAVSQDDEGSTQASAPADGVGSRGGPFLEA